MYNVYTLHNIPNTLALLVLGGSSNMLAVRVACLWAAKGRDCEGRVELIVSDLDTSSSAGVSACNNKQF